MGNSRLTRNEIEQIVGLLASWRGKLTWELLLERIQSLVGRAFTRQGLNKQRLIRTAFQQAKERIRTVKTSRANKSDEVEFMKSTIINLRAEIAVMKADRARFEEKFATWLYNARSRGISEFDLNRKLPHVDRNESTKN